MQGDLDDLRVVATPVLIPASSVAVREHTRSLVLVAQTDPRVYAQRPHSARCTTLRALSAYGQCRRLAA